jgi:membrane associated rhomboid family serine protease
MMKALRGRAAAPRASTVQAPVTRALVIACVVVEAIALIFPLYDRALTLGLGLVPARVTGVLVGDVAWGVPAWATLATHAFLHGGLAHLAMNMLFLWVVGGAVEETVGSGRFALLYAAGALAGGLAEVLTAPGSQVPVVGASGAISAALAAYALMFSRDEESPTTILGVPLSSNAVRALRYASLWIGVQLLVGAAFNDGGGSSIGIGKVAIWAHVGGFVAGLLVAVNWRRGAA